MLEILTMTEAKVVSVTNRVEKHGDSDQPAVSLGLELTVANTMLDLIDPKIREALYKAIEDQEGLPGVEISTPVLRCNSFERIVLTPAYEGWTLAVDDGVDDTTPMVFGSTKVDKITVDAKQGGTVVLKLRAGTSDVDADKLGKLAMHNGQAIWITLTAPKKLPDAIDASSSATDLPPTAGDLFADQHGPEDGGETDTDGGALDVEGATQADGDDWPFPDRPNNSMDAPRAEVVVETSRPGTRTARGREKTKAALAAGLAEHEAPGA